MGKTAAVALWLDPEKTSPYEFYQYWVNVDDADVERFLALFTFLPMDEVRRLGRLEGEAIREAKEVLAFEATRITHSDEEARKARDASRSLFSKAGDAETAEGEDLRGVPTSEVERGRLEAGIPAWQLFHELGLCKSRADARRLIEQGGGYVNDRRLDAFDERIGITDIQANSLLVRAGKKRFHRIRLIEDE